MSETHAPAYALYAAYCAQYDIEPMAEDDLYWHLFTYHGITPAEVTPANVMSLATDIVADELADVLQQLPFVQCAHIYANALERLGATPKEKPNE